MIAVGVARPIAQGQAMISTAMALTSARVSRAPGRARATPTKVDGREREDGRHEPAATRSARRWMGALEPWASSTSWTIWASTVSRPTRVARNTKRPVVLSVAPMTSSPAPLRPAWLSPVSIDSSTADAPSVTTPSTGTFSPGRTRRDRRRDLVDRARPTSSSAHHAEPSAPGGRSAGVPRQVCDLARDSSQRPARISPTISVDAVEVGDRARCPRAGRDRARA